VYLHQQVTKRKELVVNTTTAVKTPKQILEIAKVILDRYRAQYAEYEAECEEYYREGFRPQYCSHGVNMWVDYDCACGMCEEYGNYWNFEAYASMALGEAKRAWAEHESRIQLLIDLMKRNAPIQTAELSKWATEPIARYKK
jgi:hypothetical protein